MAADRAERGSGGRPRTVTLHTLRAESSMSEAVARRAALRVLGLNCGRLQSNVSRKRTLPTHREVRAYRLVLRRGDRIEPDLVGDVGDRSPDSPSGGEAWRYDVGNC